MYEVKVKVFHDIHARTTCFHVFWIRIGIQWLQSVGPEKKVKQKIIIQPNQPSKNHN